MPRGKAEHSLDSIIYPDFRFYQPLKGYRINIDTVILYHFAAARAAGYVLEAGSASGVVSTLLSRRRKVTHVTGVEINAAAYGMSQQNRELNGCAGKVEFLHEDIKNYKLLFKPQSFDTIVTNPPFYKQGTGRLSKEQGLTVAHHEQLLTLEDMFESARYLLKPKGYCIMMFPCSRLDELLSETRGFAVEVLRFIHRKQDRPADLFMMCARKGGGKQLRVVPPLFVHGNTGYSEEVEHMLNPALPRGRGTWHHVPATE